MSTIIKYPMGSEWRKWDLHIHSPLSILNNYYPKLSTGEPNWDPFIQKLESLDICVIGITDYFTIEGFKALKKFKEEGRLRTIHTILPNIEFRLKTIISSRGNSEEKRLNLHVIFSDEVGVEDIDEHFLHDIYFYFQGDPQNPDERRKLKPSNLEVLGKELMQQHAQFRGLRVSNLELGAMQAVVDHEEITAILTGDSRFKGNYLLVLSADGWDQIDWSGQAHVVRKGLLQKSDMVFCSNPKTREWCLGRDPYTEGENKFIEEFKTLKPCIHGSDAHEIDCVGYPCGNRGLKGHRCKESGACDLRYCWIKADPTFEGLKQLLYEPTERVIIQQLDPSPVKSNYTIGRVDFTESKINEELSIAKSEIQLNSNLVAVTGSKGSGKTALVDLMANCYSDRCNTEDKNSFVRRISEHNPDIKTGLTFRNDVEFSKNLNDHVFFEDSEMVYIAQGELEKYIGDDSDLDTYVKHLVFGSPQIKDGVKSFEFHDLAENIENIQLKIKTKNALIENLEQKTGPKEVQAAHLGLKQKEAESNDVERRIKDLAKGQTEANLKLVQEKQGKLAQLKTRRDDLVLMRGLLENALGFIDEKIPEFNQNISVLNGLLKKLGIPEQYSNLSYTNREAIAKRLRIVGTDITKAISGIEESQKELASFEASVRDHAKLLDRQRDAVVAIEAAKTKIHEIEKNKTLLGEAAEERKALFKGLLITTSLLRKKYNEIIEVFSGQKAEILSDLDFDAQINFDSNRFCVDAQDVVDNRKVAVIGDENNEGVFNTLISLYLVLAGGEELVIPDIIDEVEKLGNSLKSKLKGSQAISLGDFYNFMYGNYLNVVPVVRYKKTNMLKLSLGQKATVLIKIYLAQDDRPIIIDSHDDHLDNEFIMEELVRAIRQAKIYRQVILASNNGNVVINSDAEQIIVANRDHGRISYVSGSIENPAIRDRALRVLEGGAEAFKKRQQKYRLGS